MATEQRSSTWLSTQARGRWPRQLFAWLLLGASFPSLAWKPQPLDLPDLGAALSPNVVAHPTGGFVLSWQVRLADGCAALRVARLRGRTLGTVHEVVRGCDWFVNWADFPGVVIADNGDWLTWWLRKSAPDTYAYDIQVSRSSDGGGHWSDPVVPHRDGTHSEHGFVSISPLQDDRVLLLWLDGRQMVGAHEHDHGHGDAGATMLRSAVLDGAGQLHEEQALDERVCDCCGTDLVRVDARRQVAIYRDRSAEEIRDTGVIERLDGHWQPPALVHADGWRMPACPVNGPALATQQAQLLVAWSTMADQPDLRVRGRLLGSEAEPRELEAGPGVLGRVDAVAFGGDWLLSWLGAGDEGQAVLRLARLDSALDERQRWDLRTLPAGRDIGMPRMAASHGEALLVWTEVDETAPRIGTRAATRLRGLWLGEPPQPQD